MPTAACTNRRGTSSLPDVFSCLMLAFSGYIRDNFELIKRFSSLKTLEFNLKLLTSQLYINYGGLIMKILITRNN